VHRAKVADDKIFFHFGTPCHRASAAGSINCLADFVPKLDELVSLSLGGLLALAK
jgi:hypothetical protein